MAVLAFKRTRVSWATVSALSIILPTMTGNFSSMPRYVWPFFPLFMVTASLIKTKRWLWVGIVFGILQTVNLLLFTQGIFVA